MQLQLFKIHYPAVPNPLCPTSAPSGKPLHSAAALQIRCRIMRIRLKGPEDSNRSLRQLLTGPPLQLMAIHSGQAQVSHHPQKQLVAGAVQTRLRFKQGITAALERSFSFHGIPSTPQPLELVPSLWHFACNLTWLSCIPLK